MEAAVIGCGAAADEPLRLRFPWRPTFGSWPNLINTLWPCTKQNLLHYHALAGHWDELKDAIGGLPALLRCVGLYPDQHVNGPQCRATPTKSTQN